MERPKTKKHLIRNHSKLMEAASEYCENTTIHGIKYLGAKNLTWMERIFWLLVIIFSLLLCGFLTVRIWEKLYTNSMIIGFSEKEQSVSEIPFPSVTICPEIKVRSYLFNYTKEIIKLEGDLSNDSGIFERRKLKTFYSLMEICKRTPTFMNFTNERFSIEAYIDSLSRAAPVLDTTITDCGWLGDKKNCSKMLTKTLTKEGICYTFNGLDKSEIFRDNVYFPKSIQNNNNRISKWSLDGGYMDDSASVYPLRDYRSCPTLGAYFVLKTNRSEYDSFCQNRFQGHRVILHIPGDTPQVTKEYFKIHTNRDVMVGVKPVVTTTSTNLKNYDYHSRKCFFQNEKYLSFFKIYTQDSCELECLTNHTFVLCGCVKVFMPRNHSTPICGPGDFQCGREAESGFYRRYLLECNCLPPCTSIEYDTKRSYNVVEEDGNISTSTLRVFFKKSHFFAMKRSELFGPTDLLANIGGLLGLFMGVSLLSIIEFIYFFTVRLMSNFKNNQTQNI